jgi:hypothetical protein
MARVALSRDDRPMDAADAITPRRIICARCGQAFDCGLGGECWCAAESFRLPMPEPQSGADCVCPRCLLAAAQERP